jgi:TetR/AcrR family transcriptional regulator, regulator of autoinduction and epiphytic fitness
MNISDTLGGWIEAAQKTGHISNKLPALVVLYTLYARACDPVLEFLKVGGQYSDAQMLDLVTGTCFDGVVAR